MGSIVSALLMFFFFFSLLSWVPVGFPGGVSQIVLLLLPLSFSVLFSLSVLA